MVVVIGVMIHCSGRCGFRDGGGCGGGDDCGRGHFGEGWCDGGSWCHGEVASFSSSSPPHYPYHFDELSAATVRHVDDFLHLMCKFVLLLLFYYYFFYQDEIISFCCSAQCIDRSITTTETKFSSTVSCIFR